MTFSFVCPGPARIRPLAFAGISDRLSLELSVSASVTGRPRDARTVTTERLLERIPISDMQIDLPGLSDLCYETDVSLVSRVSVCASSTIYIFTLSFPRIYTLRWRPTPFEAAFRSREPRRNSLLAPWWLLFLLRETERVFRFCSWRLFVEEILGGDVQIARSSYLILITKEDYWRLWIQRGMNTVFSINFLFFWGEIGRRFVSPPKRRWTIIGNYQFVETRLMGTASYYVQISSVSVRSRLNAGNLLSVFFLFFEMVLKIS